ncbi:MAG: GNAT family N-acetyltransferase [Bacteroides sp.]|nr:GNAT family N-acetyltransferase [Bacteroides sp.]
MTDAKAIVDIYNDYILNTTISFEVKALTEDEMRARIQEISSHFVYLVYEEDGKILGYCYAHPWKERAAYGHTLETTVYLSPDAKGHGIGRKLMEVLIDECRKQGFHALIACITGGNEASCHLHEKLGFKQVSAFEKVGRKFGRWLDVVDYELLLEP